MKCKLDKVPVYNHKGECQLSRLAHQTEAVNKPTGEPKGCELWCEVLCESWREIMLASLCGVVACLNGQRVLGVAVNATNWCVLHAWGCIALSRPALVCISSLVDP